MKHWILIFTAIIASGCASMPNRTKTLLLMSGAGAAAGTLGAALTPEGESPIAHSVLWGSVAATTAGVAGLFLFDEEARRREAEAKTARLERELTAFKNDMEPELLATNRLGLSKPLPEKFRHLVTPGQWSLFKVDRWTANSDNELVHQDLIFRFHQPQLNPNGKPENETKKEDL
jgi:hypothetical protein